MRRDTVQEHISWDLAYDIPDRPSGSCVVQLKAKHVQVLLHPTDDYDISNE